MSFTDSIKSIPGFVDDYAIVWATPDHAEEIAKLVNAGYQREITRKEGSLRYPDPKEIAEEIEKVSRVGWLILQDPHLEDKIIGSLEIVKEESGKHKINAFAIDKAYSGKGLGPRILKEAEFALRQKGAVQVYLEVISTSTKTLPRSDAWETIDEVFESEQDKLAEFYQKHGYEFTEKSILTPLSWQEEYRKTAYVGRVFFREMCKNL